MPYCPTCDIHYDQGAGCKCPATSTVSFTPPPPPPGGPPTAEAMRAAMIAAGKRNQLISDYDPNASRNDSATIAANAIKNYVQSYYMAINGNLRREEKYWGSNCTNTKLLAAKDGGYEGFFRDLLGFFFHRDPYTNDQGFTLRGHNSSATLIAEIRANVGSTWFDRAFYSTACDGAPFNKTCLYKVDIQNGHRGCRITKGDGAMEDEVLFPPCTPFRVLEVRDIQPADLVLLGDPPAADGRWKFETFISLEASQVDYTLTTYKDRTWYKEMIAYLRRKLGTGII